MKLKAPKDVKGVSFEGQEYPVVKGVVEVPDKAVALLEDGFTPVTEPENQEKK